MLLSNPASVPNFLFRTGNRSRSLTLGLLKTFYGKTLQWLAYRSMGQVRSVEEWTSTLQYFGPRARSFQIQVHLAADRIEGRSPVCLCNIALSQLPKLRESITAAGTAVAEIFNRARSNPSLLN